MDNFDYKKFVFNAKANINESTEIEEAPYKKNMGVTKEPHRQYAPNDNLSQNGANKDMKYEAVNPELDTKVLGYIKDLAKFYEYSDQDAVFAIIQSLVRQGLYNPK
jgi:hypothetical protein